MITLLALTLAPVGAILPAMAKSTASQAKKAAAAKSSPKTKTSSKSKKTQSKAPKTAAAKKAAPKTTAKTADIEKKAPALKKAKAAAKSTKAPAKKAPRPKAEGSGGARSSVAVNRSPAKKAPAKDAKAVSSRKATPAKTVAPKPAPKKRIGKLRYKVKQNIVYPLHGVGQINVIEERPFRDDTLLYYIIYIEVSDMTVMVPVDRADELGIRPIVEKRESNKALKLISEEYEPVPSDWKMRYQMNLDLLKSGSVIDIATVVRTLYHRSKIKELPILERKLFDSALRLLIDEVSLSLDKTKEEVEELVFQRLESALN